MKLIGQSIMHCIFGKGVVIDWNQTTITVRFASGPKRFIYPDAFSKFLTLKNATLQRNIQALLNEQETVRFAEIQAFQEVQSRKNLLQNIGISSQSQAVFDIKEERTDELFATWSVSTGCYVSGHSKGKPRIPEKLKPNSMCLLTKCPAKHPEKERRIIGAFMVEEDFLGNYCQDGIINAHSIYRIQLLPEHQSYFWPYITHEPGKQHWGRTSFKYISNTIGENILFNMKEMLCCDESQKCAEAFYQYYCKLNHLLPRETEASTCVDNG